MSKKKADPFDIYRMPIGLTDGVVIALPDTPAKFTVRLPSGMNEEFQMAVMRALNMQIDPDTNKPTIDIDPMEFQQRQRELFFDTCILASEGLPGGKDATAFFAEYPLAKRYVFEKALELAAVSDREIDAALKKSTPSQSGSTSGTVSRINTMN